MYNDLFSIGPFTIHGYGLMIGIGFIVALLVGEFRAKKRGLSRDFLFNLAVLCLIFGVLGAKLLYMLTVIDKIIANPSDILSLSGGFVVYGGIIVGILTGFIYCRIKHKVFRNYFDIVMPSVAIAQGFGRIGCFLAGCCYGKETDSACGVVFTHSDFAPNNVRLIPTQLISSAACFLLALVLILIARKQRKPGVIAGLYLVFYGIGRFLIEFLRGDLERGSIGDLSTSQFISIIIVAIGLIWLVCILVFTKKPESIAETVENITEGAAMTFESTAKDAAKASKSTAEDAAKAFENVAEAFESTAGAFENAADTAVKSEDKL